MDKLLREIQLILVIEGQHDGRFKDGDMIQYCPSDVVKILGKHKAELEDVIKEVYG